MELVEGGVNLRGVRLLEGHRILDDGAKEEKNYKMKKEDDNNKIIKQFQFYYYKTLKRK